LLFQGGAQGGKFNSRIGDNMNGHEAGLSSLDRYSRRILAGSDLEPIFIE
jgi:hypothetical protein